MTLVIKSIYIISMHSTNFVIKQGEKITLDIPFNIKAFFDMTSCSVNSNRHFRGAYSLLHLQVITHFFCARSECLKIKQTISSTSSVHHLPSNTASYPTKLVSPTIPLPEPQISRQKYLALIFMFALQEPIRLKSFGSDNVQSCRWILTFQTCCLILQH